MTIDELAAAAGTTTRRIRSLQTLGLLPHPELRGRTGLYGARHRDRLAAILRTPGRGVLPRVAPRPLRGARCGALARRGPRARRTRAGRSGRPPAGTGTDEARHRRTDSAELYGFAELQPAAARRRGRPLLSVVPTTVWDESEAS